MQITLILNLLRNCGPTLVKYYRDISAADEDRNQTAEVEWNLIFL